MAAAESNYMYFFKYDSQRLIEEKFFVRIDVRRGDE
jgi:hypothetical protein